MMGITVKKTGHMEVEVVTKQRMGSRVKCVKRGILRGEV